MTLGNRIAQHRKNLNITQDALAQQLGVTNQAVSKWESDQCCPDVMLLPKLADIFGITLDELFGRESQALAEQPGLETISVISPAVPDVQVNQPQVVPTWPDDETLRVVAYIGHRVVVNDSICKDVTFRYEGPALNVSSRISLICGDVLGSADAGTNICCGNVGGDVDAGTSVNCGNVGGGVDAGTSVNCGDVGGDVDAGGKVQCVSVQGDIDAGGSVIVNK